VENVVIRKIVAWVESGAKEGFLAEFGRFILLDIHFRRKYLQDSFGRLPVSLHSARISALPPWKWIFGSENSGCEFSHATEVKCSNIPQKS
jgi:hypothetical protein